MGAGAGASWQTVGLMLDHFEQMRATITEGEHARGSTGDNPWVGCLIVDASGVVLARGHTQGPGEDHAEIAAVREAKAAGRSVVGATLYSTLEPCSFHGRTPACAHVVVREQIARVVIGMRDPHPRVDGAGIRILREAGLEVVEGVCEDEVRRQLGAWVLMHHPHDVRLRAATFAEDERAARVAETYGVAAERVRAILAG